MERTCLKFELEGEEEISLRLQILRKREEIGFIFKGGNCPHTIE